QTQGKAVYRGDRGACAVSATGTGAGGVDRYRADDWRFLPGEDRSTRRGRACPGSADPDRRAAPRQSAERLVLRTDRADWRGPLDADHARGNLRPGDPVDGIHLL